MDTAAVGLSVRRCSQADDGLWPIGAKDLECPVAVRRPLIVSSLREGNGGTGVSMI